jgi:putative FmdB family regulatory protein
MPMFDFHCNECGKDFESLTKPYEPVVCPHCSAQGAEKKPSILGSYFIKGDNSASTRPRKR